MLDRGRRFDYGSAYRHVQAFGMHGVQTVAQLGVSAAAWDPGTDCPARGGVLDPAWAAPLEDRAVTSWLSCYRRLQVRWERDSGRFFAFVLLACALVCFKRL